MSKFNAGDKIRIRKGWGDAGGTGVCLGPEIFVEQDWVPVIWDGDEDPTFSKAAGLEVWECLKPCNANAPCDDCEEYWNRMRAEGFWDDSIGWSARAIKEACKF